MVVYRDNPQPEPRRLVMGVEVLIIKSATPEVEYTHAFGPAEVGEEDLSALAGAES